MYLVGKGHEHMGPGTSMVQRIDWSRADEQQARNAFIGRGPGLGCVGLGCGRGMGCGCRSGLGLFDGGFDPMSWGIAEWAIVAIGGYAVLSMVFTTKRAAGRIAAIPGERRKKKAAYYRAKAAELTKRRAA